MKTRKCGTRRAKERPSDTYCVQILDWETSYSLSLSLDSTINPGPYWEHATINVSGKLIAPRKHAGKELALSFLASRELANGLNNAKIFEKWEPLGVGGITIRGEHKEFFGSLPFDAFPIVIGALQSVKYKYITLHGEALRYGRARIRSYSFEREFEEEDW